MSNKNNPNAEQKQPGALLSWGAEGVLFIIYITMRVFHCLTFWQNMPKYSNWKTCTKPDYQTQHVKEFVAIVFQVGIVYGLSFLLPFWSAVFAGVAIVNLVVFCIWLINKL